MEKFIDSKWNFTGVTELYSLYECVYVETQTGFIFDSNCKPIFETLFEPLFWNPAIPARTFNNIPEMHELLCNKYLKVAKHGEELADVLEQDKRLDRLEESVYLLHPFGWYAYGHLHDSLMRLYSMPEIQPAPSLLCSDFRRVVEFEEHIEALGYSKELIIDRRKHSRFVRIEKLHYPVNPSIPTNYTEQSYHWMLDKYSNFFKGKTTESNQGLIGIYLSRNSVKVGARGVLNESEVIDFLKSKKFLILDGSQNLSEIYSAFSSANYIVGPHGSIFVNTIFAKKTARIIEFCPRNRPDQSFRKKLKNCSNYNYILTEADENYNISIDLEILSELINE